MNDRSSMNDRRPSQLMVDKSLMDIGNNQSVIAGSTHLNTFFMRAETISNIGSNINIRSNSVIKDDQTMESLRNIFGDDLDIIKNFESIQGGLIQFKVPKAFIDNQNKKIMEKKRQQSLATGKLLNKPSNVGSQTTEDQKDRNLYMMLKIKVKFHRLLEKIRERMRKSTHYCIKARVQLIYLRHKNLIIKALIVRHIESSGWEKNEQKNKFLMSRSKLNIRGQRGGTRLESTKKLKRESGPRNDADAFQLTDGGSLTYNATFKTDDFNEKMFKNIKLKETIESNKEGISSESYKSRNSEANSADEIIVHIPLNKKNNYRSPQKAKKPLGVSSFQSSRKVESPSSKDRRYSSNAQKLSQQQLEIENLASKLREIAVDPPQEKDLFSFCKRDGTLTESPSFKSPLQPPPSKEDSPVGEGYSPPKPKEEPPKREVPTQKNFTFMNFNKSQVENMPKSKFSLDGGPHNEQEMQKDGNNIGSNVFGSNSIDDRAFVGGSGDFCVPPNELFGPSVQTQGRMLLGHNEEMNQFGVRRSDDMQSKKTANFNMIMSSDRIGVDEMGQVQEEKQGDLSDFSNGFENIQRSEESKKEPKPGIVAESSSFIMKTPENISIIKRRSDFYENWTKKNSGHFSGGSGTRKNDDNKSKMKSVFSGLISPVRTKDGKIKSPSMSEEPQLKNDISVEHAINMYTEIQTDFLLNEKTKMDKLKNCLILVNSSFRPSALGHMISFNRLSFIATFLIELIIPAISAYFAVIVGREFHLYTTTSNLLFLQLSTQIETEFLAFAQSHNLGPAAYEDMGVENVTEWLIYDILRQKKEIILLELGNLSEAMISTNQLEENYFDFYKDMSYIYSSLFQTVFLPWVDIPVFSFNSTQFFEIIQKLRNDIENSQKSFEIDKMIIYMWTPATYLLTIVIFFVLYFFLRKATREKTSILNIFFMIDQDEIKGIFEKHTKFQKILEYIMGIHNEEEDNEINEENSDKLSVHQAMMMNLTKRKQLEVEGKRKRINSKKSSLPNVQVNFKKISIVFFIYFLVQVSTDLPFNPPLFPLDFRPPFQDQRVHFPHKGQRNGREHRDLSGVVLGSCVLHCPETQLA